MAYLSLYRKYRSQDFDTIVGQKHIVQTLKNAIENNRLTHAYIFSGPRGTGKTSLARILAKALNCKTGTTVSPCLKCSMCENIKSGTAVDVIEIDAASNRGIDEIRQLREQVNFVPVEGKYKVYIIDEVHMLTTEAFNALLKTLEEPPSHTIFVLATTEIHKIPATILSRCQRLDFKRISGQEISDHLKYIASLESVQIDDKSLTFIARTSEGCMRDAISLLDQLISYKGTSLVYDDILTVLGTTDTHVFFDFANKLLEKNIAEVIAWSDHLIMTGKNIQQITKDTIEYFRNLLLIKVGAGSALELSSETIQKMTEQAKSFTFEEIKRIILLFSKADTDMRWQPNAKLLFELAVMEWCLVGQPQVVTAAVSTPINPPQLAARVIANTAVIEKKEPAVNVQPIQPVVEKNIQSVMIHEPKLNKNLSYADVKQSWMGVLQKVKMEKPALYILLCESSLHGFENNTCTLQFKENFAFHKNKLMQPANKTCIENIFKDAYGVEVQLAAILETEAPAPVVSTPPPTTMEIKKAASADKHTEQILSIFSGKVVTK